MKKALFILSSLAMAFPLMSFARVAPTGGSAGKPTPGVIPSAIGNSGKAFQGAPLHPIGSCKADCASAAETSLEPGTVRALNRLNPTGSWLSAIAGVLNAAPAISVRLNNEGMPAREAKEATNATVGAIVMASRENWDPETRENVVRFANNLAERGQRGVDPKQLNEVRENCRL